MKVQVENVLTGEVLTVEVEEKTTVGALLEVVAASAGIKGKCVLTHGNELLDASALIGERKKFMLLPDPEGGVDFLKKADSLLAGVAGKAVELTVAMKKWGSFPFVLGCGCCQTFLGGIRKGMLHNPAEYKQSAPYRLALRRLPRKLHKPFKEGVSFMMEKKEDIWDSNPLAMEIAGVLAKPMEKKIMERHCVECRAKHEKKELLGLSK